MPDYCPACGRSLDLVGYAHACGMYTPQPTLVIADEPDAIDQAKQPFDKVAYQREYMRRKRAAQKETA